MADTSGRALYLVWRPRRFDEVVGQPHVVRTIRNAVKNGTIAHAYLFSGPRGTGKTTMARLLYKAVNCLQPVDGGPCEQCAICISANEGRAMDLIEMDAASNRGIDDVRDLREKINYSPAEARYRVYILDEAHQLTQAAWDALLKTLEEPPPHAILVLATTESHKVPATVLSRCQRFDFHRHTAANIRDRLATIAQDEGIEIEGAVLSWLARAARGGMRDAISLLDQLRSFCGDRIDAESAREVLGLAGLETVRPFLEALQEERPGDALEALNEALDRGTDLRVYLGDALTYLRALMLLRYGAVSPLRAELPDEELAWLEEYATAWDAGRLRQLVGGFGDAVAKLRDPAQLLIQVELVVLGGWQPAEAGARPAGGNGGALPRLERASPPPFTPARTTRPTAT
ncbi:MAG: DNA polymerase III subunit gamma/tau, partial [Chloroflexota bacterium]